MPVVPTVPASAMTPNPGWLVARENPQAEARPQPAALTVSQRPRAVQYVGRIGELGSTSVDRLETIGETQWYAGHDLSSALESARRSAVATAQYGSPARAVAVHRDDTGSLFIEPVQSRPDANDSQPPLSLHIGGTGSGHVTQVQLFDNDVVAVVDPMGLVSRG